MQKIGGLWVRAIKEPTLIFTKKCGVWVTAETISKNMGSLGDSRAENTRSLEPYIHATAIMGVPPRVLPSPFQCEPPKKSLLWINCLGALRYIGVHNCLENPPQTSYSFLQGNTTTWTRILHCFTSDLTLQNCQIPRKQVLAFSKKTLLEQEFYT